MAIIEEENINVIDEGQSFRSIEQRESIETLRKMVKELEKDKKKNDMEASLIKNRITLLHLEEEKVKYIYNSYYIDLEKNRSH